MSMASWTRMKVGFLDQFVTLFAPHRAGKKYHGTFGFLQFLFDLVDLIESTHEHQHCSLLVVILLGRQISNLGSDFLIIFNRGQP
jgi:hypothetical protein